MNYTERLTHAVEIMQQVEQHHKQLFDMYNWCSIKSSNLVIDSGTVIEPSELPCGTASCFWAWCARDPKFQQQGVKLIADYTGVGAIPGYEHAVDPVVACARFFNISEKTAEWLTLPKCYARYYRLPAKDLKQITPNDVIKRLELLLAHSTDWQDAMIWCPQITQEGDRIRWIESS